MLLAVCGFCFDASRQRVVLIRKNRPTWQAGKLNGVGGKVDLGEMPGEAMVREFLEETGVEVPGWDLFCLHHDRTNSFEVYYFRAFADVDSCTTQTDEEVVIAPILEVQTCEVVDSVRWLVPMALDTGVRLATTEWAEERPR